MSPLPIDAIVAGPRPLLPLPSTRGASIVSSTSPLTRLNYFDGKFLRAADLKLEQDYLRHVVWLSNQGGGWGVIYGYDAALRPNGQLGIGAGLAISGDGRVLLLPEPHDFDIPAVVAASRQVIALRAAGAGWGVRRVYGHAAAAAG